MLRVQVIGERTNAMLDFLWQISLALGASHRVTWFTESLNDMVPFIATDSLGYFEGETSVISSIDQIQPNQELLITNRDIHDVDYRIVFLEQNMRSWHWVNALLTQSKVYVDLIIYWNFQIGKYNEAYWEKAIFSELKYLNGVDSEYFLMLEKDEAAWLRMQIEGVPDIRKMTRGHLKRLNAIGHRITLKQVTKG